MKKFLCETEATTKAVALDDMILTKDLPTTAGSKMLDGYMSLFDAEVVTKLTTAGYCIKGKANTGELSIDLLGETSYCEPCANEDGTLANASAEIVKADEAEAVICLDVNGTPRRAASINGLTFVKPTYGTVSRYGTVAAACSGEAVGVMAKNADKCKEILAVIAGHDDKDGTSLPEEKCELVKSTTAPVKKIAVAKSLAQSADDATKANIAKVREVLSKSGIEFEEIDDKVLTYAKTAWNVLMTSELCNNVSRYDGVKYGYRTPNYKTIDELYTNSRTESFGDLLKTAILFGSDSLSTENYMKVYDKALRIRRVIVEKFAEIFTSFDAVLLPASSKTVYKKSETDENKYLSFDEALYTAPASISGLPAVVFGGAQLIGKAFSDNALLDTAAIFEKEGK